MYMHYRKKIFNQVAHFIHINLSAALLIGLIVFVSGIEAAYDSRVRNSVFRYHKVWLLSAYAYISSEE